MRRRTILAITAIAILLAALAPTSAATRPGPEGEYYAFLYIGGADPNETSQILDQESGRLTLGAGLGWRFHPPLAFELDVNVLTAEYDLPQGIGRPDLGDEKLALSTAGVFGNLKFGPRLGRVRPHVGVGLGLGVIDVSVSNPDYWITTPLEAEISLLTQVLGGLDVRLTRRSYLGIQYREVFAQHSLEFAGEKIDGGGRGFSAAYRMAWGGRLERGDKPTVVPSAPPAEAAE